MSDKTLIKSLKVNKVFKEKLPDVWNLISDVKRTHEVMKDYRSSPVFTKGNESKEIGTEYHLIWKKLYTLYFRTEEVFESENYKRIRMKIYKSEPINVVYDNIYHFYKITSDNTTLLIWEWIYEGDGFPMTADEVDLLRNERSRMLDMYEQHLQTLREGILQTESIAIKCSAKKLLKAISNPYILLRITPSVADKYECEGDGLELGSVIRLIKDDMCTELKVCRSEYVKGIYYYDLLCINRTPKQKLVYEIYDINEKDCFMNYSHIFYEYVDSNLLQKVSEQKIEVLKSIRGFFEYLTN